MTPITRKFLQQSLLNINLGNQLTPSGGSVRDDNDGNAANQGKFRHFVSGSIYWKSNLGANAIRGEIFRHYSANGFEHPRGTRPGLGFPISDEKPGIRNPGSRFSRFEHGLVYWQSTINSTIEVRPIVITHNIITGLITDMLRGAITAVMTGPITINALGISTRVASVQPYQFHEQSYPVGGRPAFYFTNRCYQLVTNIPFTYNILNQTGAARIECELSLEVKTNVLGELVFVLRNFQGNLRDVAFGDIITLFAGPSINDSINPLCNVDIVTPLPASMALPAGTKLLSAQIDQAMAFSGNRNNLLLFVDPGT